MAFNPNISLKDNLGKKLLKMTQGSNFHFRQHYNGGYGKHPASLILGFWPNEEWKLEHYKELFQMIKSGYLDSYPTNISVSDTLIKSGGCFAEGCNHYSRPPGSSGKCLIKKFGKKTTCWWSSDTDRHLNELSCQPNYEYLFMLNTYGDLEWEDEFESEANELFPNDEFDVLKLIYQNEYMPKEELKRIKEKIAKEKLEKELTQLKNESENINNKIRLANEKLKTFNS